MLTKFHGPIIDGHITCKYCNTYLDIQEFSEYDQGGITAINREKATDQEENNLLDNLTKEQKKPKSLIQL